MNWYYVFGPLLVLLGVLMFFKRPVEGAMLHPAAAALICIGAGIYNIALGTGWRP